MSRRGKSSQASKGDTIVGGLKAGKLILPSLWRSAIVTNLYVYMFIS